MQAFVLFALLKNNSSAFYFINKKNLCNLW